MTMQREKVRYSQPTGPNPIDHRDVFSRPALPHGNLISLFHVAWNLPSMTMHVPHKSNREPQT